MCCTNLLGSTSLQMTTTDSWPFSNAFVTVCLTLTSLGLRSKWQWPEQSALGWDKMWMYGNTWVDPKTQKVVIFAWVAKLCGVGLGLYGGCCGRFRRHILFSGLLMLCFYVHAINTSLCILLCLFNLLSFLAPLLVLFRLLLNSFILCQFTA